MTDSHLTYKVTNKCLNVCEWAEVAEWNKRWSTPFCSCPVSCQCPWKKHWKKKKLRGECRSEKQYFFHYSSPYFINILNIWESEMDAWKRFICSPKCSSLLSSTYKMKVISLNCMLIKQQFHKCLWY